MALAAEPGEDWETTAKKFLAHEIIPYFEEEHEFYDYKTKKYYKDTNQRRQLEQAKKGIDRILKYGDRKLFHRDIKKNYPPLSTDKDAYLSIYTIHERCGIATYAGDSTKDLFPHWHRLVKE